MFEVLEARINSAALKKLSNATATINGSQTRVIFDRKSMVSHMGGAGMVARSVQMEIADADIPPSFIGMQIDVDGTAWVVEEKNPDGVRLAGITTVVLEKA